jgi:oligopeptide transport system substrate-binding protein
LYITGSYRNYTQYSNPKVDEVIKKAKSAGTEEESRKYWREFQRLVAEDVATYSIGNGKSIAAASNKVKGLVVNPYPEMVELERAYIE